LFFSHLTACWVCGSHFVLDGSTLAVKPWDKGVAGHESPCVFVLATKRQGLLPWRFFVGHPAIIKTEETSMRLSKRTLARTMVSAAILAVTSGLAMAEGTLKVGLLSILEGPLLYLAKMAYAVQNWRSSKKGELLAG
jgi:hypothetical protein